MKLVADISAWQTHDANDWSIRRPYDLTRFAGSVDAAWVRWTDWKGYLEWGPDPDHRLCIDTLRDMRKLVGSYLFCRPGMSTPQQQIQTWVAETPATTWAPMLDVEVNGGLVGPDLSRWVDTALAEMSQRFQRIPWLYTRAGLIRQWHLSRPTTPHLLIYAYYPYGTTMFPWAQRASWEAKAMQAAGSDALQADGWPTWGGWQFTDQADVPGMPGFIDASWVAADAFAQSGSGVDDGYNDMEKDILRRLGVKL